MYQNVETTDEEKREMYRNVPIADLIEMLIECNKTISRMKPVILLPCDHVWYADGSNTVTRFFCSKCGEEKPIPRTY